MRKLLLSLELANLLKLIVIQYIFQCAPPNCMCLKLIAKVYLFIGCNMYEICVSCKITALELYLAFDFDVY